MSLILSKKISSISSIFDFITNLNLEADNLIYGQTSFMLT